MKNYLLIAITIRGTTIIQQMGNLEEFKSVVKELVNNEIVVSAVIIEASLEKVRVQRLKGEVEKVENFKEILDETCPDWEHTENII
ncbi:MAG TPA: hypothetical protein PLD95_03505 [bacterium]|nr:hypothetical protein [bacterium]HOG38512.1 hypothetical protein [bacterium]HQI03493.1 hypothetical protein [bacterium]